MGEAVQDVKGGRDRGRSEGQLIVENGYTTLQISVFQLKWGGSKIRVYIRQNRQSLWVLSSFSSCSTNSGVVDALARTLHRGTRTATRSTHEESVLLFPKGT